MLAAQKSSYENLGNVPDPKTMKLKSANEIAERRIMIPDSKKKLSKINSYEVETIGTEIRFGLQLKRIPMEEIETVLILNVSLNILII